MSIATRLFVQTALLLVVTAALAYALLATDAQREAQQDATIRSVELATSIAVAPTVVDSTATAARELAAGGAEPATIVTRASAALQPYALSVVEATGLDFVTIMAADGTRYTHPERSQIGKRFLGNIDAALRGGTVTEVYEGTLGPSVRAVVPVTVDGTVVALVACGITIEHVDEEVGAKLWQFAIVLALAVAAAGLTAALVSRRLRRVTGGHDPEALARLFATHEAALHSVDDGLVLVRGGTIELMNDRAKQLLGVRNDAPFDIADARLGADVRSLLRGDSDAGIVERRSLLIERSPARVLGEDATMLTIRDRTELRSMAGELDAVRTMARALRSQTHEFGNRLHTIATLIELDEPRRALELAADGRDIGQRLTDRVIGAHDEPVIAALLLGKAAEAHERGVELHVETHLLPGTHGIEAADFVSILGNLIDNGIDAAAAAAEAGERGWVEVYLAPDDDDAIVIQVTDSGAGIPLASRERVLEAGWSTKDGGDLRGFGLAVVADAVARIGGGMEISGAVNSEHGAPGAVVTVRLPVTGVAG